MKSPVRFAFTATKGPEGDVRWLGDLVDGRLASAALDESSEADITLTLSWPDARAVVRGELDLNAAFMSGRMKVSGPTGPLLELLAAVSTPRARGLLAEMAAQAAG